MKLSVNDYMKIQSLYRQGNTVPELAKKFNLDFLTIIKIGRGSYQTVHNKLGKIIFSGYEIDTIEFCEKNPKKWAYKISIENT